MTIIPISRNLRRRRRLVICGSMSARAYMIEVRDALNRMGIPSLLPDIVSDTWDLSADELIRRKRRASIRHMRRIMTRSTEGVVVVNVAKYGVRDYIGPNTFGEIAVAFAHHKRVFLWQGIPDQYEEELVAWGAEALLGELGRVSVAIAEVVPRPKPDQLVLPLS